MTEDNKPVSAVQILNAMGQQLEQAIPEGGPRAEQYQRMMIALLKKNPDVAACTPTSIQNVALEIAQLGLLPDNTLGQAYVLPFKDKGVPKAQYILGYRGMIELCCRGGDVAKVEPRCVLEGDVFQYEYGLQPALRHVPASDTGEEKPVVAAYVVWHYRDRSVDPSFYVMSKKAVDRVRKRSKSGKSGPWQTDYEAMAMKTVIRHSAKYQRVSLQALHAIQSDEERELSLEPRDLGTFKTPTNVATDELDGLFGAAAEGAEARLVDQPVEEKKEETPF